MADENRANSTTLKQILQERPCDLDFFQIVRRFECANAGLPRIGGSQLPKEDPIRFSQNVSLAFAPSAITDFKDADDNYPAKLVVSFFGLLGANGPLPAHITEYIRDRVRNHGDSTLASFLDIFNHRMTSLFYQAWARGHQTVSFDRGDDDSFAFFTGSLMGISEKSCRNRDSVPDVAKLHYSGRFLGQLRNAEGLQAILEDYFGITVSIQQHVGQWIDIPVDCKCRIGESIDTGTVGLTTIIGSHFWECNQKFRLRLGPMDFPAYERLLPGGNSLKSLVAWVRNYIGDQLSWELQLVLNARDIKGTRLGFFGRLGFSTWLKSGEFKDDAEDLVLRNLCA